MKLSSHQFSFRANVAIRLRLKEERAGRNTVRRGRSTWHLFPPHAPQEIDPCPGHLLDDVPRGVAAISHHLLWFSLQTFFDAFHCRQQLRTIVPFRCHRHPDTQSVCRIRGNLRVVTQRQSSIRVVHHSRLTIATAHACLALGLLSLLAFLQPLQFLQVAFHALSWLSSCPLTRPLGSGGSLFLVWVSHLRYELPCAR